MLFIFIHLHVYLMSSLWEHDLFVLAPLVLSMWYMLNKYLFIVFLLSWKDVCERRLCTYLHCLKGNKAVREISKSK